MWHILFEKILPFIVAVETPEGSGTGFLFAYNENKSLVAFATAAHVVRHADGWKQPMKLRHHVSGKELFLQDNDRIITIDHDRDSASILMKNQQDYWPPEPLSMFDSEKVKKIGVDIGWAGYPSIAHPQLCLFTGRIAAFVAHDDSYLIDGVAINGVSGGPVFCDSIINEEVPEIIGTISAYIPNRQRGDVYPGILQAHDLTSFHETIKTIKSLDDLRKRMQHEAEQRRQAESAGEIPPANPVAPTEPPTEIKT